MFAYYLVFVYKKNLSNTHWQLSRAIARMRQMFRVRSQRHIVQRCEVLTPLASALTFIHKTMSKLRVNQVVSKTLDGRGCRDVPVPKSQ
jgi:hypothetical protein